MLKPQDLLVALKFASLPKDEKITFAILAESLSMSVSEVFAATKRAKVCRLIIEGSSTGASRYRPIAINLREFLLGGLRYVFPVEPGKATRGFLTAQDAFPLSKHLGRPDSELPLVWPHPEGDTRGFSIEPIFPSAPNAARKDERLSTWLTLSDAIRVGDARVRMLAATEIGKLIENIDHVRL